VSTGKKDNTMKSEHGTSHEVVYGNSGTALQTVSYLEKNWQKLVSAFLLLLAGLWFYSEYTTTMQLKNEEASLAFSNAVNLLDTVIANSSDDVEVSTDALERYLDEIRRLEGDLSETTYGNMAKVLSVAYSLSRTSGFESVQIEESIGSNALLALEKDFSSQPMERLVGELTLLLHARQLLTTGVDDRMIQGKTYLKKLIEQGVLFPVEASVSYLLSFDRKSEEFDAARKYLLSLVNRYPQIESSLVNELARFGIILDIPGETAQDALINPVS
jgi:hypothetical protein